MGILQAHISEHVSLQATEIIQQKYAEQMQELQAQAQQLSSPEQEMQIKQQMQQIQTQMASDIAVLTDKMTTQMITEEQEMMQGEDDDPLIRLKEQELQLKAMDMKRKEEETDIRVGVEREKMETQNKIAQDKMESQEDIAQLRAEVNLAKQNGSKKR